MHYNIVNVTSGCASRLCCANAETMQSPSSGSYVTARLM